MGKGKVGKENVEEGKWEAGADELPFRMRDFIPLVNFQSEFSI